MGTSRLDRSNRFQLALRLGIAAALRVLFLATCMLGLRGAASVRASPATLYVYGEMGSDTTDCTDAAGPCATIGYALDQAGNGDTILVAMGTYTENLVIAKTITLEGGYEPVAWSRCLHGCATTIDGNLSGRVIEVRATLSETTMIDGFTITNGDGGISALLSSVAIGNSRIVNNHTTGGGGGIRIDHSFVTITNSLIADNTADLWDGAMRIVSTTAISGPHSEVTINSSTIVNNRAPQRNGIACSLSSCEVVNSIVWGHEGEDFWGLGYYGTYSDIEMGLPGAGNISEDPRFIDPASGDYHLRPGSPCIDVGTNEGAPETDFEGDRRPFDGDGSAMAVIDMGMDEVVLPYNPGKMPAFRPDLDWDRDVDIIDIMLMARALLTERGDREYRQYYNLHHDGRIDVEDLGWVTPHWREKFDLGPHFPLAYSPYRPGQAPGGSTPSPAEIGEDMEITAQDTNLIRTYGACAEELAAIPGIAHRHGVHVYQGVELTSTPTANAAEMACLATLVAQHENIVAGVIGNETLLSDSLSEPDLIGYLDQARETGNVPVTTGEPWGIWCNEVEAKPRCQARPDLARAVDFILAHSYPYWEKVPIDHGVAHVVATYLTLRALYPDRVVVIGETGWPTCGAVRDNAVPSLENQRRFIEELWRWANLYHIPVFYFEALDEDWKIAEPGGVGPCWGLYYADRTPKHDNLNWSVPTPEPTPTEPAVRIDHPRDITATITKPNCGVPVFGRAYNAEAGWHVKVEVLTDGWYTQDKWYSDGLAPIVDGMWGMPEVILAGQDGFNNHSIRATLVDETGTEVARDEVAGIMRTNSCSP